MDSASKELTTINVFTTSTFLLVGLLVGACGGGGGGGGGNNGTPPANTPVNISDDSVTRLSGRLWHNNYPMDYRDGAQIASLTGDVSVQVTPKLLAWPWRDGSQYVTTDPDSDKTDLKVRRLADSAILYELSVDGYLRGIRPSPISKSVILATWGDDSISTAYAVFYDLEHKQVLDDFVLEDAIVDWLPDGRYVRLNKDGSISSAIVGGALTVMGTLAMPDRREILDMEISPDGSRMLLRGILRAGDGGIEESDLWIANIDGSDLRQFTKTGISAYGSWSPDSSYITFNADTGVICAGFSCAGTCSIWYAKATAQNLDALSESDVQAKFRVKNQKGKASVLGCEVQDWTE